MDHDGNAFVRCACGQEHWGTHGAAGLLLEVGDVTLLQLRPRWAHQGGTWAIPGGARDSHETAEAAALREAHEEAGLDPGAITVRGVHRMQHPDWSYDTVLADAASRPEVSPHAETVELRWVDRAQMSGLPLHPGFAASLPELLLPRVSLVVDAANVVGSRPDGWWRDRPAAARRLVGQLEGIAGRPVELDGRRVLLAHVEAVVEGVARGIPDRAPGDLVHVTRAPGSGDETIVDRARSLSDVVVVTSDRALGQRVERSIRVGILHGWLGR